MVLLSCEEAFQFTKRFRRGLDILNNFALVQHDDAFTDFGNMYKIMT